MSVGLQQPVVLQLQLKTMKFQRFHVQQIKQQIQIKIYVQQM